MSDIQRINAWFDGFDREFSQIIPTVVAETATEYFQERFVTQEWDGIPWPSLSPGYASRKSRGRGRILTASGTLQRSIAPTIVTPNRVVISAGNARSPYARVHNEGLRITGVRQVGAYTNSNFMGRGKPVKIPAHQRSVDFKMPQRQFIGTSKFLNQAIRDRLIAAYNARQR